MIKLLTARSMHCIALAALIALSTTELPAGAQRLGATPAVLAVQVIGAARAAAVLRALYPRARITVEAGANA
ncbi:MAG TPA: hypothetical protein VN224_03555, partial [Xanthomonadales bacterium]|nr:hypothetical protein [Xanthomonadales bacterium]